MSERPSSERLPASPSSARLEIRVGAHMHVVLEGEPAFVMEAYARVQADVARALVGESQRAESLPTPAEPDELLRDGPAKSPERLVAGEDLLWLYRCEDDLRTVYVTPRSRFAESRLARALGLGAVERVYVEDERLLRALRKGSRTLWREIEPAGKQRLQEAARRADTGRAPQK